MPQKLGNQKKFENTSTQKMHPSLVDVSQGKELVSCQAQSHPQYFPYDLLGIFKTINSTQHIDEYEKETSFM